MPGGDPGTTAFTSDLDIVPDPERENLVRVAGLLAEINAEHVGLGVFSPDGFPFDPRIPDQLARGDNFRLNTTLRPLDIIQLIAGIVLIPGTRRLRGRRSR